MKTPKPGSIGIKEQLTPEQLEAKRKALLKSPKLSELSEPFITDNGRTLIYFKKGDDVQQRGEEFLKKLSGDC